MLEFHDTGGSGRNFMGQASLRIVSVAVPLREELVQDATHSARLEGLEITAEAQQDSQSYISGDLSAAQLVERAQARASGV